MVSRSANESFSMTLGQSHDKYVPLNWHSLALNPLCIRQFIIYAERHSKDNCFFKSHEIVPPPVASSNTKMQRKYKIQKKQSNGRERMKMRIVWYACFSLSVTQLCRRVVVTHLMLRNGATTTFSTVSQEDRLSRTDENNHRILKKAGNIW